MPGSRKSVPNYLRHKQSGRGRVVWTDSSGDRRSILLPGEFNSAESRTAYRQFLADLEGVPGCALASKAGITLAELLLAFVEHAERHDRLPDGELTSEIFEVRIVARALRELYADKPVAEFGPLCVRRPFSAG